MWIVRWTTSGGVPCESHQMSREAAESECELGNRVDPHLCHTLHDIGGTPVKRLMASRNKRSGKDAVPST